LLVAPTIVLVAFIALFRISHLTGSLAHVTAAVCAALAVIWLMEALLLTRMLLTTVRATTEGIETRTPWDGRQLLRWKLIDQVERQAGVLRLHTSDGLRATFIELGLTNSRQLLRQILLRVSPAVLSASLQQDLAMLGGPTDPNAELLVPVAPQWIFLASVCAMGGIGLAVWGRLADLMPLLIVGIAIAVLSAGVLLLFRQTLTITETDMALARGFGKRQIIPWSDIGVVDKVPLDMALALRLGDRRMIFLGPFFFAPSQAELFRSTMGVHVFERGVPIYQAWRIW
jgi:hypothetical protein